MLDLVAAAGLDWDMHPPLKSGDEVYVIEQNKRLTGRSLYGGPVQDTEYLISCVRLRPAKDAGFFIGIREGSKDGDGSAVLVREGDACRSLKEAVERLRADPAVQAARRMIESVDATVVRAEQQRLERAQRPLTDTAVDF